MVQMKRSLEISCVAFVLVVISLIGSVHASGVEVISNGSFEQLGSDGVPRHFVFVRYGQGNESVISTDSNHVRTGSHSIRVDGFAENYAGFRWRDRVEGGKTYQFSIWYYHGQDIEVGQVQVRMMAFESAGSRTKVPWDMDWITDPYAGDYNAAGGVNLHISSWQDESGPWNKLTVTFKLPENVTSLDIEGFNWRGNGSVWFDDISLIQLD